VPSDALLQAFEDPPKDFDVVGLGENSLDEICTLEGSLAGRDKQRLLDWRERAGGQVAGTVLGCARLGLRAAYVGSVGDDPVADRVLAPLIAAGVDVSGVRCVPGAATRRAVILVRASDGDRSVLAHRDAHLDLDPAGLDPGEIERARLLHIDTSDVRASLWAAGVARRAGVPVVLDADASWAEPERLLAWVDFPVVTAGLAEEWGRDGCLRSGLERMLGWGARLAVVTRGAQGAEAACSEKHFSLPAFDVNVVDTTGSGDAFRAGFIWGLLNGECGERAVRIANAVAALSCRARGAQEGLPNRSEVEALLGQASHEQAAG